MTKESSSDLAVVHLRGCAKFKYREDLVQIVSLCCRGAAPGDQGDDEQHEEYEEQNFRRIVRQSTDQAESEQPRNQRDDQK